MSITPRRSKLLLSPRFWPLWLVFGVLWLVTRMPIPVQHVIGRSLGYCLYWLGPARRHIAEVNIRLCFPELSSLDQRQLLKRHFTYYGIGLIESFTAWWGHPNLFIGRVEFTGLENLRDALKHDNGVLLLGGHFSTLEVGVRLLGQQIPFDMMYRPHKNPLFESIMSRGRERWSGRMLSRKNIRGVLRSLKANHPVWYGPDQDYGRKHSVFAPFMGVMAATVTGTSKIAKLSSAAVVPYFVERLPESKYRIHVYRALDNFPTDNAVHDAVTINNLIEQQVRISPENYLWTHRRFKTRPPGEDRPY